MSTYLPLENSAANIDLFQKKILHWFKEYQRKLPWRETKDPYCIWISEVMLQQTQVATVVPYFQRFLDKFPNIHLLAASNLQDVLKMWEGLGYYGRARNLHKSAIIIRDQYSGIFPGDYDLVLKLPGVGVYIASSVLSIAFDRGCAAVDGNVKRVLSRLFLIDYPVNESKGYKRYYQKAEILLDKRAPGDFNQAMMELGATVCLVNRPLCSECPVINFCLAYQKNKQSDYPKRKIRNKTPLYHIAVGIVERNGKLLITRRKEQGLLGGLWEFPGGKINEGEFAQKACEREIMEEVNIVVRSHEHLATIKHAYTHFKIIMEVYLCSYMSGEVKLNASDDFQWITPDQIKDFPFPGANHKFFPALKKYYGNSK